jgi:phosphatidylinositol alpha-1,6-mannosyltransferase
MALCLPLTTWLRIWTHRLLTMRLLIVTNDYPPKPGGIQMYLRDLVEAYPDEVHVVAPYDPSAGLTETGVSRGTTGYMLPTRTTARAIATAADRFDPEAVLFGAPHPLPFLGDVIRRAFGVPIGVLSHGAEVTIPGAVPGFRQILGRNLASADVRFAVSRYTARKVQRISGKPVEFLGAGVDTSTFTPANAALFNDPPVVGCVSRFVPRKGQDRLIEAAADLDQEVELLFVGKGRTEDQLRRKADKLGVRARFEVDVPWSQLPGLYQEMDIFCMPCKSRWGGLEVEGLGLVFLEAAATGIPVLAGDSGGSPETVLPGQSGFVVPDVDAIVEGLEMLLGDPPAARRMGAEGRRLVESEFTWERVVDRLHGGFEPFLD